MQPPLFVRVAKVFGGIFGGFVPFFLKNGFIKTSILGRPLTKNVLSSLDLESRFYAVLSKAASSGLASNPRRSKSREPKRPKGRESVRISRKDRNGVLTPRRHIMNEFTDKNEQGLPYFLSNEPDKNATEAN